MDKEKKEDTYGGSTGVYPAHAAPGYGDRGSTIVGSDHERGAYGSNEKEDFYDPSLESRATRMGLNWESFKRAPGATRGLVVHGGAAPELVGHQNPLLQQKMKPRHLAMIAVGGSIGTGLFVASGGALRTGGPAGVIIAWCIIGVMLVNVTQALGEMAIVFPVSGGFYTLASRMLDPSFAFAMGWNYVLQWAVVLPLELVVAGQIIQWWDTPVPLAAWITIFMVLIIALSILGTLGYAEEEFFASTFKLVVVVIIIIAGIICVCGGGPRDGSFNQYVGARYWYEPGAFANGFKGVCTVFVSAAFSFAGTELVGLAATETPNPRKALPAAVKQTFWRVVVIYITSLTVVGMAIPYTDPDLQGGESGNDVSPFVLIVQKAAIRGLPDLMNLTICISVLSVGLSCVYAGSRTLTALAETHYAPKIFTYVDKSSRPLMSVLAILAFSPLAYLQLIPEKGNEVFNWLLALSGLSTLFTWGAICVTHIRFRRAWKVQGHSTEELPFRAMGGVYGSWLGAILVALVLIAQFYIAVWPLGYSDVENRAEAFFLSYLAFPILLAFWVIGYWWKRTLPRRAHEIDIDTGRKTWFTVEEMRAYRAERRKAPLWKRVFRMLFTTS